MSTPPPPPPRSPFASESWEPRFVIEHHDERALRAAIELWMISSYALRRPPRVVTHVARHSSYLLIGHPSRSGSPGHEDPWEVLAPPIEVDALAAWIGTWLTTATYPELPRFDDEAQGFCVFWRHYRCAELERRSTGQLVVMPKWIELHK